MVALGNKRARTVVAGIETKAGSPYIDDVSEATESTCSHSIRVVTHGYEDRSYMKIYKVSPRRRPRYPRMVHRQKRPTTTNLVAHKIL